MQNHRNADHSPATFTPFNHVLLVTREYDSDLGIGFAVGNQTVRCLRQVTDAHKKWRRTGALNYRFDWVANALGLTFVDPNSWVEDGDFARDGLHLNGRGKSRLVQLYARVSGLDVGGSAEKK
jgi:hypothetical protein